MKVSITLILILGITYFNSACCFAQSGFSTYSNQPRYAKRNEFNITAVPVEPKNIPDFVSNNSTTTMHSGTTLKADVSSETLPVETRLKLIVDYPIDARSSQPGDIFEAKVKDDLFLGRNLILARGSLVRGHIIEVQHPRIISRAGRVGLQLEQLVTPTGEVVPLDAKLEFAKGITNRSGQLDPGTSFGTRVSNSLRNITGLNSKGGEKGAIIAANVATLGAPTAAVLIGSSAIALFSTGDNVNVKPGQEIEILLTNDLGIQVN